MSYKLIEAIKAINYKDLATRAMWTFLQAFLAVIIFSGESIIDLLFKGDWEQLYVLALAVTLSAIAAGLSAVKTILVEVIAQLNKANQ